MRSLASSSPPPPLSSKDPKKRKKKLAICIQHIDKSLSQQCAERPRRKEKGCFSSSSSSLPSRVFLSPKGPVLAVHHRGCDFDAKSSRCRQQRRRRRRRGHWDKKNPSRRRGFEIWAPSSSDGMEVVVQLVYASSGTVRQLPMTIWTMEVDCHWWATYEPCNYWVLIAQNNQAMRHLFKFSFEMTINSEMSNFVPSMFWQLKTALLQIWSFLSLLQARTSNWGRTHLG